MVRGTKVNDAVDGFLGLFLRHMRTPPHTDTDTQIYYIYTQTYIIHLPHVNTTYPGHGKHDAEEARIPEDLHASVPTTQ
jgi:hypothetical protein